MARLFAHYGNNGSGHVCGQVSIPLVLANLAGPPGWILGASFLVLLNRLTVHLHPSAAAKGARVGFDFFRHVPNPS